MISKLNPTSRSVTVEWYERGETKGKEVEFDMIVQLNPDILGSIEKVASVPTVPVGGQNLSRVSIFV